MFEFGRELKRLFQSDGPREGLTGGDASLLELLDLDLLRTEARAADLAVARAAPKDRPRRNLEAAVVWREVARRTGDAAALCKAASTAEFAAAGFDGPTHTDAWARARCEQALCALLGAELFGDEGLDAAAGVALTESLAAAEGSAALVGASRAVIEARSALLSGDRDRIAAAAAAFEGPIAELEAQTRRRPACRLRAVSARADRLELLAAFGARVAEPALLRMAIDGLDEALVSLDPSYEPLTWVRVATSRGAARAALAQLSADIVEIAESVNDLVAVLENITRSHSPLDWSRAQEALAGALQMLGEATDNDRAFDQAIGCHDRALMVVGDQPGLAQRGGVAYDRAVCLARRAELRGDLAELATAETALREELRASNAAVDPVGWAVRQLNFARLYEARAAIAGRDAGERRAAATALAAALDVFSEHGHRSLSDLALRGLARLGVDASQT
jgi:tetratricopeptide (TPR) repeat protein